MKLINDTAFKAAWLVAAIDPPQLSATWIVKGTFRLLPGAAAVFNDRGEFAGGDLPYADGTSKGLRYESDFAPFKPRVDVLLTGTCHAPGGRPTSACNVSMRVGRWTKTIVAVGDRRWQFGPRGATASEPVPFTSMPIRHERAYGGPQYVRNPLGRGHQMDALPNLEYPNQPITSPSATVEPAGCGPVPRIWQQRTSRLGTYDDAWLKERWPWFPNDFDWSHFNAAPPDQQLEYVAGDETIELTNLHARHQRLEARLPGLRPQLFVVDGHGTREALLRLDTVWIDTDDDALILVWRGSLPVQSIKLVDLREVHVVQTRLEQPPMIWTDLVRAMETRQADATQAKAVADAREAADAAAFDATIARLEQEAADALQGADDRINQAAAALSAELEPLGLPAMPMRALDAGVSQLPHLAEFLGAADVHPGVASSLEECPATDPNDTEAISIDEPWTRERCLGHAAAGGSFAGQDLSGLNLAGVDLSGCDFTAAVLAGAILTGAQLSRCDFSGADLSSAVMLRADLTEADFTRADLTGAQLSGARLDRACLERTTLADSAMSNTSLRNVRGDRADFSAADLTGAILRHGRFYKANFSKAALARTDFSHASLEHAMVEGAHGPRINFASADLTSLHAGNGPIFTDGCFVDCDANGSYWAGALLDRADFTGARLMRADFESASLRQARLDGADLRHAVLDEATLDQSFLRSANLFRASLQRASLLDADLTGANLFEADVWHARLEGAQLADANLQMTKLVQAS